MEFIKKIEKYSWLIISLLLLVVFFRQCGIKRDIDRIQKVEKTNALYIDSTFKEIENINSKMLTKKEVKDEMEQVMFNFLIYEDDLDKGKISLSEIENKIKDDEE